MAKSNFAQAQALTRPSLPMSSTGPAQRQSMPKGEIGQSQTAKIRGFGPIHAVPAARKTTAFRFPANFLRIAAWHIPDAPAETSGRGTAFRARRHGISIRRRFIRTNALEQQAAQQHPLGGRYFADQLITWFIQTASGVSVAITNRTNMLFSAIAAKSASVRIR